VKPLKKLPVGKLIEGMVLEQDVFAPGQSKTLLLGKDIILSTRQIGLLKTYGIASVYVAGASEAARVLVEPPRPILTPQLRDNALQNLTDIFDCFRQEGQDRHQALLLLEHMDTLVDQLVRSLQEDKNTQVHITDIKSYDEYTYHHSLSVSVLSIAIGLALRLGERQLQKLGKCAMLHDIGKIAIPLDIINKPARLNEEEANIIRRHSSEGYRYLNKCHVDDPLLLSAVLFHHERYDGNGYPGGLKGDKIPLFSRIITVADVYDALTSYRSYRDPESPGEAVEYIMGNAGTAFDYDVVCAMIKKLELYPVGSIVRLSNGQKAVVIDNSNVLRPMVKLLESGIVLDLHRDYKYLNLTIRNILPFGPQTPNNTANSLYCPSSTAV
jgi:putative nucleotidyltransferase with HDIG domain